MEFWGIRLTRDSWKTTIVTESAGKSASGGSGFKSLEPLCYRVSRVKWMPRFLQQLQNRYPWVYKISLMYRESLFEREGCKEIFIDNIVVPSI